MKKLSVTIILSFLVIQVFPQVPQAISYQSVVRDLNGNPLAEQNVSLRISILEGDIDGDAIYAETHSITTNKFGLINIKIGMGTPVTGDFSSIGWWNNEYFSKIEIDITGGMTYVETGTSQLLSVPYAFYAQKAGDIGFNFIITGFTDITLSSRDSVSIPIYIHMVSGESENVTLDASAVPEGITVGFEKSSDQPDFLTRLIIESSENAVAGLYTFYVNGTSDNGKIRAYPVTLKITKTLSVELTIKDATSWSLENPGLDSVPGAIIKLYENQASFDSNSPEYTITSDEHGVVWLYDLPQGLYLLTAEKDDLFNICNGYLIQGVFQNQEDIDNSPSQPDAVIGEIKYADVNGDGVINVSDQVSYDLLFTEEEVKIKTIFIGK